jgi:hypothetical protein
MSFLTLEPVLEAGFIVCSCVRRHSRFREKNSVFVWLAILSSEAKVTQEIIPFIAADRTNNDR